jgi:hypothetical protein
MDQTQDVLVDLIISEQKALLEEINVLLTTC